MITVVLKNLSDSNSLIFERPEKRYNNKINQILQNCHEKNSDYVCLSISRPHRPRTTGANSQNNLFWELAKYIIEETGSSKEEVEAGIKERAVSERNYPTHLNVITKKQVPDSMTVIDTVDMSKLIDTEYQVIAELGIELPPNIGEE